MADHQRSLPVFVGWDRQGKEVYSLKSTVYIIVYDFQLIYYGLQFTVNFKLLTIRKVYDEKSFCERVL